MSGRKKSRKGTHRKDLTASESRELEALKAELTDSLESGSSQNSSFGEASGAGNVLPIASDSKYSPVSSSPESKVSSLPLDKSDRDNRSGQSITMTGLDEALAPLKNSRSSFKGLITCALRELQTFKDANNLDVSMFNRLGKSVNNRV